MIEWNRPFKVNYSIDLLAKPTPPYPNYHLKSNQLVESIWQVESDQERSWHSYQLAKPVLREAKNGTLAGHSFLDVCWSLIPGCKETCSSISLSSEHRTTSYFWRLLGENVALFALHWGLWVLCMTGWLLRIWVSSKQMQVQISQSLQWKQSTLIFTVGKRVHLVDLPYFWEREKPEIQTLGAFSWVLLTFTRFFFSYPYLDLKGLAIEFSSSKNRPAMVFFFKRMWFKAVFYVSSSLLACFPVLFCFFHFPVQYLRP